MLAVTVILGTRPEAIKLAPVILALKGSPQIHTQVVLSGQHRDMVDPILNLFGIQADHDLAIMQSRQTLTDITERTLRGLQSYWQSQRPDLVVVQGDTTTAFAATLGAFYQRIPVAHVEAGLRTDDLYNPYPEEANRRLISQLASLHFAPTPQALLNLQRSDVVGRCLHTGNTVIDALLQVVALQPPCPPIAVNWEQPVLLVTVHRRENWGDPLQQIIAALQVILERHPQVSVILPLHRNPVVRDPLRHALGDHPRAQLVEPLDYAELVAVMQRCTLILTDSGGIQEEAPALGKPVLVLRQTTERPEAIAAGTALLVGTEVTTITAAVDNLLGDPAAYARMAKAVNPFGDGQASARIVSAILEFADPDPTRAAPQ